jgi:hypothetical protein
MHVDLRYHHRASNREVGSQCTNMRAMHHRYQVYNRKHREVSSPMSKMYVPERKGDGSVLEGPIFGRLASEWLQSQSRQLWPQIPFGPQIVVIRCFLVESCFLKPIIGIAF